VLNLCVNVFCLEKDVDLDVGFLLLLLLEVCGIYSNDLCMFVFVLLVGGWCVQYCKTVCVCERERERAREREREREP
jgi:hypothetical protein